MGIRERIKNVKDSSELSKLELELKGMDLPLHARKRAENAAIAARKRIGTKKLEIIK